MYENFCNKNFHVEKFLYHDFSTEVFLQQNFVSEEGFVHLHSTRVCLTTAEDQSKQVGSRLLHQVNNQSGGGT